MTVEYLTDPTPKNECWWCGDPAEFLCDHFIGRTDHEKPDFFTCDAALCRRHATLRFHYFACSFGEPNGTVDDCPEHADFRAYPFDPYPIIEDEHQADYLRRKMYRRVTKPEPR